MPIRVPPNAPKGGPNMGVAGPNVQMPKTPPAPAHYGGGGSYKGSSKMPPGA